MKMLGIIPPLRVADVFGINSFRTGSECLIRRVAT